jgi:uncharacterized protein (DUF1778 family)
MKKLFIAAFAFISVSASAQTDKFTEAMGKTLKEYGEAKTNEALVAVEAKFERIAEAEKTQWLPYYYAALIKTTISFSAPTGDKDKITDEAQVLIDKADALEKNSSEILVIKSMIQTAKMLVDPMSRYMKNGAEATKLLEAAKKADETNPRPYMLQASNLKNTPEQFGGGCGAAKPLAEKAVTLYGSFKPKSAIHPIWGKESVDKIVADCK